MRNKLLNKFLGTEDMDFSSWIDFGILVDILEARGLLGQILVTKYKEWKLQGGLWGEFNCFTQKMFSPDRFANAVASYLIKHPEIK